MFFVLLLSLLCDACDGIINRGVCCVGSFCSLNMSHPTPTQHLRLDFHALTLALPHLYFSLSISSWEIQIAVCQILPSKLLKHTISESTKFVTKFSSMVHPDTGISNKAITILNSFVRVIATEASKLAATLKNQPSHHGRSRLQFVRFFLANF